VILKTDGVIYGECVAICLELAMNKIYKRIKKLLI